MDTVSASAKLASRFEQMAAKGLIDVKFFVKSDDEASADNVLEEVVRMYEAVERGEEFPLDFEDSAHP
jgi:hypothetical protein